MINIVNIRSSPSCQCGADVEDLNHLFFECHYSIILIGYLLTVCGNDKLINEQIVDIFNYVITSIFTAVKMGFHKYHKTFFSRSGVNQM
jgi:hypothetical protein